MLKALRHELRLGVTREAISLLRVNRWRRAVPEVLAEHSWRLAAVQTEAQQHAALALALQPALQQAFDGSNDISLALHIVLADDLCRMFHVTPPPGALKLADLKAAAALRFQALYGAPLAGWELQAQWSAAQTFLAAALPETLLAVLRMQGGAPRPVAISIAPHFIHLWNRHCRQLQAGAWFGVLQDHSLTLGVIEAQQLRAIRCIALPPAADAAWLKTMLARQALLLDLNPPALLQLCGVMPSVWQRQANVQGLDAVQDLSAARPLARRLALAGGTA